MMKRKWTVAALVAVLLVAVIAGLGYLWLTRRGPTLTIATWSGTYGRAQITGQILPFARASRADVIIKIYDGGTEELAKQVALKQYLWDVIDLEQPDAVAACNSGLLEKLDTSDLPAGTNGIPASDDFVPGAIGPCWVASVVYSQVIAYNPRSRLGNVKHFAASLTDFFDTTQFPGKRALNRASAKLNLEMALLADGVKPEDVYKVLSTPQGIARALAKLDTIRADLIWWTKSGEPAQMLADGRAAYATIANWAVFDADTQAAGPPLGIIWDHQLYEMEVLGIPKDDPRRALGMDYIRFATQSPQLARLSSWAAFGPARRSALHLVQDNPELKIAMTPYLPTAHFDSAFAVDDGWWRLHGADVEPQWQAWLAKGK
jgi:putative spermidine/putrescine transport system substrate-binding protein